LQKDQISNDSKLMGYDTKNLSITQLQYLNENLVIPSIQHLVYSPSILTNFQVSVHKVQISAASKTLNKSDFDVGVDYLFSIFKNGKSFFRFCLFCNFIRNRIYATQKN
jgi:hypothetical protein